MPTTTSMKHSPLISIVTPSFNQADFIVEALESVRLQNADNYEHLVIDGMSTDGTVDLLRNHAANTERKTMLWISERDTGQSEALNKGFQRAKGEIIGWLNSDDRYRPNCFEYVVRAFEENPDVDIVYGDYLMVDAVGKVLKIRREIEFSPFVLRYHHALYIPTTATFFRRRVFDEGNRLDETLQYAMDLEFCRTSGIALSMFRDFSQTSGCSPIAKHVVIRTDSEWNIERSFWRPHRLSAA